MNIHVSVIVPNGANMRSNMATTRAITANTARKMNASSMAAVDLLTCLYRSVYSFVPYLTSFPSVLVKYFVPQKVMDRVSKFSGSPVIASGFSKSI